MSLNRNKHRTRLGMDQLPKRLCLEASGRLALYFPEGQRFNICQCSVPRDFTEHGYHKERESTYGCILGPTWIQHIRLSWAWALAAVFFKAPQVILM